jgi:hypothetical protein
VRSIFAVNIPPHLAEIIANHPKLFLSTAPSTRTIQAPLLHAPVRCPAQTPGAVRGPHRRQAGTARDRTTRWTSTRSSGQVLDGKGVRLALMLTPKHVGGRARPQPIDAGPGEDEAASDRGGFPNGVDMVLNSPQGRFVRDRGGGRGRRGTGLPRRHSARPCACMNGAATLKQHGRTSQGGARLPLWLGRGRHVRR